MRRIRAATFNVLHGQRGDGSGVVDLDLLVDCAAGLDADLLALQEADVGVARSGRADQPRAVAEGTGMEHVFAKAISLGRGRYGNALLARGPISDVELLRLPKHSPLHEWRVAIVATVRLAGIPVSVAATHLSIHREEVHEQLDLVVAALAARPAPAILLGDLNLLTEEVEPVVRAAGMHLAGGGATFPADDPRIRIDHVAVAGLGLGEVEVVQTKCSDHRALVVDLR